MIEEQENPDQKEKENDQNFANVSLIKQSFSIIR